MRQKNVQLFSTVALWSAWWTICVSFWQPCLGRFWFILRTKKCYRWHLKCALFYAHDLSFHTIPTSTEIAEFLYILCRKKYRTPFRRPSSAGSRSMPSAPPPPAATAAVRSVDPVVLSFCRKNKKLITRWKYPNVNCILLSVYLLIFIHRYPLHRKLLGIKLT